MNAVANCELYRIRKSTGTYMMAVLLAAMSVLSLGTLLLVNHFFSDDISILGSETFFDGFSSYTGGSIFKMALLLFIASMVTKMYQSGAAKQIVSSGIKRRNIVVGQFKCFAIVLGVMAIVLSLVQGICDSVLGKIGSANPLHLVLCIAGILVTVASLTAFSLLLSHLTANLSATIAIGGLIIAGGSSVMNLLTILTGIDAFQKYWIDTLITNATSLNESLATQLSSIGILAVFTAAVLAITTVVFGKKEIR